MNYFFWPVMFAFSAALAGFAGWRYTATYNTVSIGFLIFQLLMCILFLAIFMKEKS